jgi:hypothetical protein
MKTMSMLIFTLVAVPSFADQATPPKGDFFISGFETSKTQPTSAGPAGSRYPVYEMTYPDDWGTASTAMKGLENKKSKTRTVKAVPVTAEENADALKKTLESFQKAISGLCISHLELSLAFNVSAKAWMIVTGEVDASVKVILKNPDEKCPKS